MDLTTIDATGTDVREGDAVTLLGCEGAASIDAQQIARWREPFPTACCAEFTRA